MKSILFIAVTLLSVLAARPLRAAPADDAAALNEEGKRLYGAGELPAALERFRAAHELSPEARFLYNIASVLDDLGRAEDAVAAYERYLSDASTDRESEPARYSRERIDELRRVLATRALATTAARGAAMGVRPVPLAAVRPAPPRPSVEISRWYRDPLGGILVGTGVVAVGVGLGFYVSSRGDLDAELHSEHEAGLESAQSKIEVARIVGGVGAVLVIAGTARWILRGDRVREVPTPVGLRVVPEGAVLTVGGSF